VNNIYKWEIVHSGKIRQTTTTFTTHRLLDQVLTVQREILQLEHAWKNSRDNLNQT